MNDLHFIEVDAEEIIAEAKEKLGQAIGERLLPGDERLLTLLHVLQHIIGAYAWIDQVGRSNLLRYASGEILDAMGERVDTERIQANPAETILQFTLAAAQPVVVIIPSGTRVTPDGEVYFATTVSLAIPPGTTVGKVPAKGQLSEGEDGAKYNGYPVGAINALVDTQQFDMSVTNTEESYGGMNRESDDAYRERVRLAPTKFSTAGPKDAYVYHALSANSAVVDANAAKIAPGEVMVTLLLEDGTAPEEIVASVLEHLNDRAIRPLTDLVHVEAAEEVSYDIELKYYVTSTDEAALVTAVEGKGGVLDQYLAWQDKKLGRDIDPDKLRALLFPAGVQRISLTAPVFTEVSEIRRARHGTITVSHEVMET